MLHSTSNAEDEDRLRELVKRCEGAYAESTLSGYRTDLKIFQLWCSREAQNWLPASPVTVASFIDAQIAVHRSSTIKRRVTAINFAHRMSDLPDPTDNSTVRLAMRRASRAKIQRPEQAQGLTHEILQQILGGRPTALNELRDTALISVGYDTLCRSSEIARMRIEHLNRGSKSAMSILIPISKADSVGNGRITHLSPATVEHLKNWIDAGNIVEGPIFQGLHLGHPSGRPLKTSSIRRIVKRAALRAGVRDTVADRLSGHSMRIGAAQDMMVNGFDMLAIMQAGGWRKPDVVLRYVENAATRRLHERRWAALSDGAIFRS